MWEGRLLFASAEVAQQHPGYMEGALLAAERAVTQIEQSVKGAR
jgi:monoamine oxidase